MAELNTKFYCKANNTIEEIDIYTTLEEVQNAGVNIRVNGVDGYIKYGSAEASNASQLNCKLPNDNNNYKIHKQAKPPSVFLVCKDIDGETILTTVHYQVPDNGELYLNNENAPSINGYDFVLMEGIRHKSVPDGESISVYYVKNTVYNRAKTNWDGWYYDNEVPAVLNTYGATSMVGTFEWSGITDIPKINTSNVVDMESCFRMNYSLGDIFQTIDTSKVANMDSAFRDSSCRNVTLSELGGVKEMTNMFKGCMSIQNVKLTNTNNLTTASEMFSGSSVVNVEMPDSNNLVDISNMFYGCHGLETVILNTSRISSLASLFLDKMSLKSVILINTSNVTNMNSLFRGCIYLQEVSPLDTSKVSDMDYMFNGCAYLTINWEIDMSSCATCNKMFSSYASGIRLKNVPSTLDLSTIGTTNYTVLSYI